MATGKLSKSVSKKTNTSKKSDIKFTYRIQCPDGEYRNYPYSMRDDALFDARLYSKREDGCNHRDDPDFDPKNPCPGSSCGMHIVKNIVSVIKVTVH
jgi:hypothetical protein